MTTLLTEYGEFINTAASDRGSVDMTLYDGTTSPTVTTLLTEYGEFINTAASDRGSVDMSLYDGTTSPTVTTLLTEYGEFISTAASDRDSVDMSLYDGTTSPTVTTLLTEYGEFISTAASDRGSVDMSLYDGTTSPDKTDYVEFTEQIVSTHAFIDTTATRDSSLSVNALTEQSLKPSMYGASSVELSVTPQTMLSTNSLNLRISVSKTSTSLQSSLSTTSMTNVCQCSCRGHGPPIKESLSEYIKLTITNLTVDKRTLTKVIRTRTSVGDGRPSAHALGWLSILILFVTTSFFVIPDFKYLVQHILQLKSKPMNDNHGSV